MAWDLEDCRLGSLAFGVCLRIIRLVIQLAHLARGVCTWVDGAFDVMVGSVDWASRWFIIWRVFLWGLGCLGIFVSEMHGFVVGCSFVVLSFMIVFSQNVVWCLSFDAFICVNDRWALSKDKIDLYYYCCPL